MSEVRWGWADKGKKGHRFPDVTDRSNCGKAVLVEVADVPTKDRCAACKKAEDAAALVAARAVTDATPTRVVDWFVRPVPGGPVCPSSVHAGEAVRATVSGTYGQGIGSFSGTRDTVCGWCAAIMGALGFFVPDAEPVVCVRCQVPAANDHNPCCDKPLPHGRALCCPCHAKVHNTGATPCH